MITATRRRGRSQAPHTSQHETAPEREAALHWGPFTARAGIPSSWEELLKKQEPHPNSKRKCWETMRPCSRGRRGRSEPQFPALLLPPGLWQKYEALSLGPVSRRGAQEGSVGRERGGRGKGLQTQPPPGDGREGGPALRPGLTCLRQRSLSFSTEVSSVASSSHSEPSDAQMCSRSTLPAKIFSSCTNIAPPQPPGLRPPPGP